jgi:hypothetical protein
VDDSAVFDTLTVDNATFTGWTNIAYYQEGNSVTGQGVNHTFLNDLYFSGNGRTNGGGTGDISFWEFNEDATLTNLTLVGSRDGVTSFERSGIQFRGVGGGDGVGVMNAGTVTFDTVDISGTYQTQMIGIQRYLDVSNFSFTDVALGGAGSGITGSFGAALRFDGVGQVGAGSTIDLGNTHFRGGDAAGALPVDIEFAPDNTFAFLTADATDTIWSGTDADLLTTAELFGVEDRILHALDFNAGHAHIHNGLAVVRADNVYVTPASGSIQRGIDAASAGWTVNIDAGTFTEAVLVDKALTLIGDGIGATTVLQNVGAGSVGMTIVNSDVTVSGILFDGQDLANTTGVLVDASGSDVEDVTLQAVGFRDLTTALRTAGSGGGVRRVEVTNSVFEGISGVVFDLDGGSYADTFTVFDNRIVIADLGADLLRRPFNRVLNASGNFWGVEDGSPEGYRMLTEAEVAGRVVDGGGGVVSGRLDFTPFLTSGDDLDNDLSNGFQGDFSELFVTALGGQSGSPNRIQEGIDLVSGSTVLVGAGTFAGRLNIDKSVTLLGAQAGTRCPRADRGRRLHHRAGQHESGSRSGQLDRR